MSRKLNYAIAGIVVCCVIGLLIHNMFMYDYRDWYRALVKPSFQPPDWVFGPVWTTLYILMGLAFASIAISGDSFAMSAFLVQLILNLAWTPLFFGMRQIGLALADIILLIGAVIVTMFSVSGLQIWGIPTWLLLAPYLGWLTYAAALNAALYVLN
jgi:benzodiazapine receptor